MLDNYKHWHFEIDEKNLLWLWFDKKDASANTIDKEVLEEFEAILNHVNIKESIVGLIIGSAKEHSFIVGADINQFVKLESMEQARNLIGYGQQVLQKLESMAIPTVAMIDGFCLGGGMELALACRYRVATDSNRTKLGLPEVTLGIQPGWGGTIRLPRLTGILAGFDLFLTGRLVDGKAAKKMGLVNETVAKRILKATAAAVALSSKNNRNTPRFAQVLNLSPVRTVLGQIMLRKLKKKAAKEHYPAPYAMVNNWVKYGIYTDKAYVGELDSICELVMSKTSKNLVKIFFLQNELKATMKQYAFDAKHVHVIGAGVMGGDIAAWCAFKGFKVTLQDVQPKLIASAIGRAYHLGKKKLKEEHLVTEMMDRLIPDLAGNGVFHADLIIEAIYENLDAKRTLFHELEQKVKKNAILATNTSTIPLEEIAVALRAPERLIGIHFFNPVDKMPLVEIVKGERTSAELVHQALAFVGKIEKFPVEVKSSPGFLVNRILLPYMLEAVIMLEEGVSSVTIDRAALNFGMPMGPIELADKVGLDVCLAALTKLAESTGNKVPAILQDKVTKGELGLKSGRGFYLYRDGKIVNGNHTVTSVPNQDLTDRLIFRMLNEAVACMREGIVENETYLNAGSIFGFGFPPFRGGVMNYINEEEPVKLFLRLKQLQTTYGVRFSADVGWNRYADVVF